MGNKKIDCFYDDALVPKVGPHGRRFPVIILVQFHTAKKIEVLPEVFSFLFTPGPLHDFCDNESAGDNPILPQGMRNPIPLFKGALAKKMDPGGCVNEDFSHDASDRGLCE